jgi:hypothetical protein
VGATKKRRKKVALAVAGAGAMALAAASMFQKPACRSHTMGAVAAVEDPGEVQMGDVAPTMGTATAVPLPPPPTPPVAPTSDTPHRPLQGRVSPTHTMGKPVMPR